MPDCGEQVFKAAFFRFRDLAKPAEPGRGAAAAADPPAPDTSWAQFTHVRHDGAASAVQVFGPRRHAERIKAELRAVVRGKRDELQAQHVQKIVGSGKARPAATAYQDYHMCDPDRVEAGPDFVPG